MKLVGPALVVGALLLVLVASRKEDDLPSAEALHIFKGEETGGEVRLPLQPGRVVAVTVVSPMGASWVLDPNAPVDAKELRATSDGDDLTRVKQTFEFAMPDTKTEATTLTFYLHKLVAGGGGYSGPLLDTFTVTLVRPSGE